MRYRVLGVLEIQDGQDRVLRLQRRKQRILLALLLFRPNTVVRTSALLAELWDDDPPASAAANLQSYVAGLRRVLGRQRLETHRGGYLLRVADGESDAEVFTRLATEGAERLRAGAPAAAAELLTSALELWRGPVLDGLPLPDTLRADAARLEDLRMRAVEDRLAAQLDLGRHHEAAAELRVLTARHPLRERLWSLLMLALYRWGRQDEALDAYQRMRRMLADELGIEPGREVRRMHQRILTADPSLDRPDEATAVTVRPRELPPDVAHLVGRDQELSALDGLVDRHGDDATHTVITAIVGPAGVGKTALAVHWAHRAAQRYPDGQLFVDLRGQGAAAPLRPLQVLTRFLYALGLRLTDIPDDPASAAAKFRSALSGRRMLVVLDNAASAEQIRPLLPATAGCTVLVTSRNRLAGLAATHDTHHLHVGTLPVADSVALLARVLGEDRVAAEPAAAEDLAAECAGLPLALRVVAANLDMRGERSVATYLAKLRAGDLLAELTLGGDPGTAVRAAFDASYTALSAEAARLFALLGLVPGRTFSTLAAAALANVDRAAAERAIEELVATHMVDQVHTDSFGMHSLLRRYAAAKVAELPVEVQAAARRRLVDYYVVTASGPTAGLTDGQSRSSRTQLLAVAARSLSQPLRLPTAGTRVSKTHTPCG